MLWALSSSSLSLLRAFEDESRARLGVVECAKHELLQPFNVMQEKDGEWALEGDCLFPAKNGGSSFSACQTIMCRV